MSEEVKKKTMSATKTISLKINTGNFETVDITQSISGDIEYATKDELMAKNNGMTRCCIELVKDSAEKTLEILGRHRMCNKTCVELWGDTPNGPLAKEIEGQKSDDSGLSLD